MAKDVLAQTLALAALGNSGGGGGNTDEPFECAGATWSEITDVIAANRELQYTIAVPVGESMVATLVMRHPIITKLGVTVLTVEFYTISADGSRHPAIYKVGISGGGVSIEVAVLADYTFQPFGS